MDVEVVTRTDDDSGEMQVVCDFARDATKPERVHFSWFLPHSFGLFDVDHDDTLNVSPFHPIATCIVLLETQNLVLQHSFERLSLWIEREAGDEKVLYASYTADEALFRCAIAGQRAYCIPLSTTPVRTREKLFPLNGALEPGSYLHTGHIKNLWLQVTGVRRAFEPYIFAWVGNVYCQEDWSGTLLFV